MTYDKLKVLFILHTPPPIHGAAMVGQYIRESEIINEAIEAKYLNLGTSRTVDEIGKGGFKKCWRYLTLLWKTVFRIISFRPNRVYLTLTAKGGGFYKDALVVIAAKALGAKLLYHFHNKGVSARQDQFLDNLLYKIVFKNAEVILLSKYLYPDIQKYVPEDRVHYCPNGIPEVGKMSSSKNDYSKKVEILFLSNLLESKGIFVLFKACKILQQKEYNFHCSFVGGEGDINKQKFNLKVQELDLQNSIKYLGKKYGKDKEQAFLKADIFAFPTFYHNECFPLVLLEAMQFSLPIITTFEGAIPEIVKDGENGYLVAEKDALALADKLEVLIKNPTLRKNMGKKGRQKYEQEFTLEKFEKRMVKILHEITI